ncbi:MAG: hypothetical protein R2867_10010 [Caldilineaceae bacterium]
MDFDLAVWIDDLSNALKVTSDLYFMIWSELEKHQIEIPFPQQDLHLRSAPWEELRTLQRAGRPVNENGVTDPAATNGKSDDGAKKPETKKRLPLPDGKTEKVQLQTNRRTNINLSTTP